MVSILYFEYDTLNFRFSPFKIYFEFVFCNFKFSSLIFVFLLKRQPFH